MPISVCHLLELCKKEEHYYHQMNLDILWPIRVLREKNKLRSPECEVKKL